MSDLCGSLVGNPWKPDSTNPSLPRSKSPTDQSGSNGSESQVTQASCIHSVSPLPIHSIVLNQFQSIHCCLPLPGTATDQHQSCPCTRCPPASTCIALCH